MPTPAFHNITQIQNPIGLTQVPGFKVSGVSCDIRHDGQNRLDLCLIKSDLACNGAAVFTTNDIKAAPVYFCQKVLDSDGPFHGIITNSGNANACTGAQGDADAAAMARHAEQACRAKSGSFFSCSTGHIGRNLPMPKIMAGIKQAASILGDSTQDNHNANYAILTSDTRSKQSTVQFKHNEKTITIASIAKGSGMIEPNMATMLAYITTDVLASNRTLQDCLRAAVHLSFNAITIDGDMSTNDTVILLANGHSKCDLDQDPTLLEKFSIALKLVCEDLSLQIVRDGEGVSKVVRLKLEGAPNEQAAEKVARAIGNSMLVKSAWYGNDPNWGRVLDAAGYARIGIRLDGVRLYYSPGIGKMRADAPQNIVAALLNGTPQDDNEPAWHAIVKEDAFTILIDLGLGTSSYTLMSTDLTEAYVDFNKSEQPPDLTQKNT